MRTPYPGYDVLAKWDSVSFDDLTRGVLHKRLHEVPGRRFFTEAEFALVEAICARLVPQPDREQPVPIAPWIDADLADSRTEGFRHPDDPLPQDLWRKGLAGVEAEARRRHGKPFVDLDPDLQDAVLTAIQNDNTEAASFGGLSPRRFFTDDLLKAAVGVYYAHPAALSEVGFGGPASPRGYVRLGLDERDPWEAPLAPTPGEGL